jgi:hypothetical protein
MRGKLLVVLTSILFLVACGNETEEGTKKLNNDNNTVQPINYETEEEEKERTGNQDRSIGELGGYPQSEQEYVNEGDRNLSAKNEDRYTNERTMQISDYLSERKEIVQAQVSETEDRIIVAVQTGNKYYPDLKQTIEEEVKQIVSDKEIVVYTESIWWDRMRNQNSSPNLMDAEMEENINDFFGND